MDTVLHVEYGHERPLPPLLDHDIRTPPALVEAFVAEYTDPGETVLDPFAGFGTTLRTATDMGRTTYGVEYDRERVEHIQGVGGHGTVVHGDARELGTMDLPTADLVFTSPPFMVASMAEDPLQNYAGESDYERYLGQMRDIFDAVGTHLAADGHAVLDVSNMKHDGHVTTLAWDLADVVRDVLHFEGEVAVVYEDGDDEREGAFGYGYDHSYALVFSNPETTTESE